MPDDREPLVRLRDWLRQAGLAHGDRTIEDVAASTARMRAASERVLAALDGIEGLTQVERRQVLMLLASTEMLKAVVQSGVLK